MRVVRIIADLTVTDIAATQTFYGDFLGLGRQEMGLDWVTRYVAQSGANLEVLTHDATGAVAPVLSGCGGGRRRGARGGESALAGRSFTR